MFNDFVLLEGWFYLGILNLPLVEQEQTEKADIRQLCLHQRVEHSSGDPRYVLKSLSCSSWWLAVLTSSQVELCSLLQDNIEQFVCDSLVTAVIPYLTGQLDASCRKELDKNLLFPCIVTARCAKVLPKCCMQK